MQIYKLIKVVHLKDIYTADVYVVNIIVYLIISGARIMRT